MSLCIFSSLSLRLSQADSVPWLLSLHAHRPCQLLTLAAPPAAGIPPPFRDSAMETAPLEAGYRSQSRGSTAASPAGIRIDIPPPPTLPWGGSSYDNSRFYTAKGYLPPEPEPVSEQPTPSSQTSSHSGALPSPAGSRASEGRPQVAGVQPSLRTSATLGTLMEQLGSETQVGSQGVASLQQCSLQG